jgi:hypothetical protein
MATEAKKFVTLALVSVIFTKVKEYVTKAIAAIPGLGVASAEVLGGIKVGDGLAVNEEGVASVDFSTATAYADTKYSEAQKYADTQVQAAVADLIGGAPETYDTLKEVADYIEQHKDVETSLNAAIGNKANSADVYSKTDADSTFVKAEAMTEATEAEIDAAATAVFG